MKNQTNFFNIGNIPLQLRKELLQNLPVNNNVPVAGRNSSTVVYVTAYVNVQVVVTAFTTVSGSKANCNAL